MSCDVVNVSSRRDSDPTYLRSERVAEVVAIEIKRGDQIEIFRPQEYLL